MVLARPSDQKTVIAVAADTAEQYHTPVNPTLLPRARWAAADVMGPHMQAEAKTPSSVGAFTIHDPYDNAEEDMPFMQLAEAIPCAYEKFKELDTSACGNLDHEKLHTLLIWLLERFHPGGKPLSAQDLIKINIEMAEACDTSNGKLSFEDFTDWLEVALEDLHRVRRVVDWQQQVRFDELECEVIDIHLPESDTPAESNELLSESAKAALRRHRERPVWICCYLG